MAETIDIRELNIMIEQQSGFVTNLVAGMDQVIVGQKHLVDSLLISVVYSSHRICFRPMSLVPRFILRKMKVSM